MNNIKFDINLIENLEDGEKYNISIQIPILYGWLEDVNFIIQNGNNRLYFPLYYLKTENEYAVFENTIFLETKAIYKYFFNFKVNSELKSFTSEGLVNGDINDNLFKMSVNYNIPDWAKGKIMYHIFIDRFYRGDDKSLVVMPRRHIHDNWYDKVVIGPDEDGIWNNDFYGGDLKGIVSKLDYIKSLGVSILYLSPVVYSQSTHRYDTSDYEQVDPYAGGNDDLKLLCEEAHKKDMKVILDAVFNHTGNDSKYFNEYGTFDSDGAFNNLNSSYLSFYKYSIQDNKPLFEYWWGMKNLPVCNGNSEDWKEYITGYDGIIDKWFNLGIDGLRLDVADELTDEFIELIRKAVKRNKKDGFILGEVWKNPMRMGRGYIESGKGMDSVMNYNFISALIKYFRYGNTEELKWKINEILNEYPEGTLYSLMNFTSTHDMSRGINLWDTNIFNEFGEWPWNLNNDNHDFCQSYYLDDEKYKKFKEIYMAYIFSLNFMPGDLSIFYGDEVGIQGLGNLDNRKPFPWNNIDEELLDFFRYIGNIRTTESFMEQADFNLCYLDDKILTFERIKNDEKLFVAVSRFNSEINFELPNEYNNCSKVYSLKKSIPGKLNPYGGIAVKK